MKSISTRYLQYLATVTATLSVSCTAMQFCWTSPVIPKIKAGETPFDRNVSDETLSWMVSSCSLGSFPGIIIAGWAMDKLGRQRTLLLAGLPLLSVWIVAACTNSILVMCIARGVAGIGMIATLYITPIYIGEISEEDIRGKLSSIINVLSISGDLFTLTVGPNVSYLTLALASSAFPIIYMCLMYFMPETPQFLIKVGKDEEAEKCALRLYGNSKDIGYVKTRLEEMKNSIQDKNRKKGTLWECITEKKYRKSMFIGLGMRTLVILSGVSALVAYLQPIIASTKSSISPELSSVLIGVIQLPIAIICAFIVDKMGRKPLLILSCLGCAIALIGEGLYFYMQNTLQANVDNISWLPTSGLVLYFIMRPLGIGTISFVIMGELFAAEIKEYAMTICGFYTTLLSFFVMKYFEPISIMLGKHVIFWFFAAWCVLGALFVLLAIPETKGKTLTEIQKRLSTNKSPGENKLI